MARAGLHEKRTEGRSPSYDPCICTCAWARVLVSSFLTIGHSLLCWQQWRADQHRTCGCSCFRGRSQYPLSSMLAELHVPGKATSTALGVHRARCMRMHVEVRCLRLCLLEK